MNEPWKLTHLKQAYQDDLTMCHTDLERDMAQVMYRRDLARFAAEWAKRRKLTPGEKAILAAEGLDP